MGEKGTIKGIIKYIIGKMYKMRSVKKKKSHIPNGIDFAPKINLKIRYKVKHMSIKFVMTPNHFSRNFYLWKNELFYPKRF